MDILDNRLVKTRKDHYCAYCGGKIEKGSQAKVWVCSDGGEIQRNYGHLSCDEVVEELGVYDDEYIHDGYLQDRINDFYGDNSSDLPDEETWNKLNVSQKCQLIIECINKQSK